MKPISKELFYGLVIETFGISIGLLLSDKVSQLMVYVIVTLLAFILAFGDISLLKLKITKSKTESETSQWKWGAIWLAGIGWGLSLCLIPMIVIPYSSNQNLTVGEFSSILFLFFGLSISLITRQLLKAANFHLGNNNVFILFLGWGGGLSLANFLQEKLRLTSDWLFLFAVLFGALMTGIALNTAEKKVKTYKVFFVVLGWVFSFTVGLLLVYLLSPIASPLLSTTSSLPIVVFDFVFGTVVGVIGNAIMYQQLKEE